MIPLSAASLTMGCCRLAATDNDLRSASIAWAVSNADEFMAATTLSPGRKEKKNKKRHQNKNNSIYNKHAHPHTPHCHQTVSNGVVCFLSPPAVYKHYTE
jgi:hypothetical protein